MQELSIVEVFMLVAEAKAKREIAEIKEELNEEEKDKLIEEKSEGYYKKLELDYNREGFDFVYYSPFMTASKRAKLPNPMLIMLDIDDVAFEMYLGQDGSIEDKLFSLTVEERKNCFVIKDCKNVEFRVVERKYKKPEVLYVIEDKAPSVAHDIEKKGINKDSIKRELQEKIKVMQLELDEMVARVASL